MGSTRTQVDELPGVIGPVGSGAAISDPSGEVDEESYILAL